MSGKGRTTRKSAASRTERAAESLFELNEFELNLVVAINAFNRWIVRCMSAPGLKDFSTFDALVLNCLSRLQSRNSLADICSIAHLPEKAAVSRSLKKLHAMGLVTSRKRQRESFFFVSPSGRQLCRRCRITREMLMMATLAGTRDRTFEVGKLTKSLHQAAALYDEAERICERL